MLNLLLNGAKIVIISEINSKSIDFSMEIQKNCVILHRDSQKVDNELGSDALYDDAGAGAHHSRAGAG